MIYLYIVAGIAVWLGFVLLFAKFCGFNQLDD